MSEKLLRQGCGAGMVVLDREPRLDLAARQFHEGDGVGLAVDIDAHQQGITHRVYLLHMVWSLMLAG